MCLMHHYFRKNSDSYTLTYLVLSAKRQTKKESHTMQEIFRSSDFVTIEFGGKPFGRPQSVALPALGDFRVTRVAGLAVGERFAIESNLSYPSSQNLTVYELQDALGEWMAIGERKAANYTDFVVLGDSSGYCPIFYAEDSNHVVVADTFMGAVHGLKHLGLTSELDIAHYVATLFPAHPHFNNPSVRRTMAQKIQILGIDDVLLIQNDGTRIINRSELSRPEGSSYEDLLARGSRLIKGSIEQLSKVKGLQKVLSLSGGVDSRLVLSMITSSGRANEFEVSSVDPRTWKNKTTTNVVERDIAIADKIRTDLGLEWTTIGGREFLQFDFRDSLNFHQSYKSNFAHSFSASPGHMVQTDLKITFRGGGGELLRSTLTSKKIAEQIEGRFESSAQDLGFTDWYMSTFPVLVDERHLVQEYISDTFNAVSGTSLTEKLNELYRQTRNRTHFGHVRQSGSTNNYALHPLSNQHFSQASQLLGFDERSTGKMVRDLYNLNDPSLLNVPFENEQSTEEIANAAAKNAYIPNNEWKKALDRLKNSRIKATPRQGWTREERLIHAPFDKLKSSRVLTAQCMKLLEDFVDSDLKKTLRRVNSRAFEHTKTNVAASLSLCVKVASALDVFLPSQPKGRHIRLFTSTPNHDTESSISKVRIEYPVRRQDGWHNQPVPEFSPELSIGDDTATVSIGLSGAKNSIGEYAVYLYKNKKRIDKSWYAERTTITFNIEGPGLYSAQVFYRVNSAHRTSIGIRTNEVLID